MSARAVIAIHTELSIICFCYSPNADTFQGREKSVSACSREALEWQDKEDREEKEEGLREYIPCQDQRRLSACDDPEKQDRENQRQGDHSRESVRPEVMGRDVGGSSSVVFYERCSILSLVSRHENSSEL